MSDRGSPLGAFVADLQRRRVTRTVIAYGVLAWIVMQASELVVPGLGLPEWVFRAIIVAALAGFPVVAVLSWLFDVGKDPQAAGPHAAPEAEGEAARATPATVLRFTVAAAIVAATVVTGWRVFQRSGAVAPTTVGLPAEADPDGAGVRDMLAVLPFESLSSDEADAFLAVGLHDELLTQFTKLEAIGTLSRDAMRRYRDRDMSAAEICADLGCRYALSASVQPTSGTLTVRVSVIDAGSGVNLWAESFTEPRANAAALQARIAARAVEALDLELGPAERARIERTATATPSGYEEYLRGRAALEAGLRSGGRDRVEHWRRARDAFVRAVEHDPTYALGWAELAMQHLRLYWWNLAPARESVAAADEAIRRATALDPDLPQLHLVRGQRFLMVDIDPAAALAELGAALRELPGDDWARLMVGGAQRRQGDLDGAVRSFESVLLADPRGPMLPREIIPTRRAQRRWADVWELFGSYSERASPIGSEQFGLYLRLHETGDTVGVRATLDRLVSSYGERPFWGIGYDYWVLLRDYPTALEMIDRYGEASDRFPAQWGFAALAQHRARVYAYMGLPDSARYYATGALRLYEAEPESFVGRGWWHGAQVPSLALLGRRDEALAHADSAIAFLERDLWMRDTQREERMKALVTLGEYDEALDEIEVLLQSEYFYGLTRGILRYDPHYDPLRELSRFREIVAEPGG